VYNDVLKLKKKKRNDITAPFNFLLLLITTPL